jgi:hypothetical protein
MKYTPPLPPRHRMNSSNIDRNALCPNCTYNCSCGSIHVTYCTIEGCNHSHTFKVPSKQTCEVWKHGVLIALEEDRPIPLIRDTLDSLLNPKSPYGPEYGVMLNGGIQVWRYMNLVSEIHPDGTVYRWYNPTHLLHSMVTGDRGNVSIGSFMQVFPDGSFKARIEALTYVWGPPVLRTVPNDIPMVELYQEITLDYSRGPHPESCECSECIYAFVKPVYYHTNTCLCASCTYNDEDDEDNDYCSPWCDCNRCLSDDSRSSVTTDSYMNGNDY